MGTGSGVLHRGFRVKRCDIEYYKTHHLSLQKRSNALYKDSTSLTAELVDDDGISKPASLRESLKRTISTLSKEADIYSESCFGFISIKSVGSLVEESSGGLANLFSVLGTLTSSPIRSIGMMFPALKLITIMSNLTTLLNELLRKHNSHCSPHPRKRSDTRDEFLKEAYRIVNTPSIQTHAPLCLEPCPDTCS